MSDSVDQAQEYIDLTDAVAVQNVRNRIVPWAETCATCQDILEHKIRVGQR